MAWYHVTQAKSQAEQMFQEVVWQIIKYFLSSKKLLNIM